MCYFNCYVELPGGDGDGDGRSGEEVNCLIISKGVVEND